MPPEKAQSRQNGDFLCNLRRGYCQTGAVGQEPFDFPKGHSPASGNQDGLAFQFHKKGKTAHRRSSVPPLIVKGW